VRKRDLLSCYEAGIKGRKGSRKLVTTVDKEKGGLVWMDKKAWTINRDGETELTRTTESPTFPCSRHLEGTLH
jgi:hypothetical protein